VHTADTLSTFNVPIILKSGSPNLLEPSGTVQACNGIALPFICNVYIYIYIYIYIFDFFLPEKLGGTRASSIRPARTLFLVFLIYLQSGSFGRTCPEENFVYIFVWQPLVLSQKVLAVWVITFFLVNELQWTGKVFQVSRNCGRIKLWGGSSPIDIRRSKKKPFLTSSCVAFLNPAVCTWSLHTRWAPAFGS
jgi:hypothetical protein